MNPTKCLLALIAAFISVGQVAGEEIGNCCIAEGGEASQKPCCIEVGEVDVPDEEANCESKGGAPTGWEEAKGSCGGKCAKPTDEETVYCMGPATEVVKNGECCIADGEYASQKPCCMKVKLVNETIDCKHGGQAPTGWEKAEGSCNGNCKVPLDCMGPATPVAKCGSVTEDTTPNIQTLCEGKALRDDAATIDCDGATCIASKDYEKCCKIQTVGACCSEDSYEDCCMAMGIPALQAQCKAKAPSSFVKKQGGCNELCKAIDDDTNCMGASAEGRFKAVVKALKAVFRGGNKTEKA